MKNKIKPKKDKRNKINKGNKTKKAMERLIKKAEKKLDITKVLGINLKEFVKEDKRIGKQFNSKKKISTILKDEVDDMNKEERIVFVRGFILGRCIERNDNMLRAPMTFVDMLGKLGAKLPLNQEGMDKTNEGNKDRNKNPMYG